MSRRLTPAFSRMLPAAIAALVLILLPVWAQDQKPQVMMGLQNPPPVKFSEDLPDGTMRAKATTSCTECHEARIIVQQRLNKAAWTKEVDKMIKWGAVVDPADRDGLIDYLNSNFGPDRTPYQPPRTTVDPARKTAGR